MNTILLTGGAGFIGSHLAEALLKTGDNHIICIDNFDDFYSLALKRENLESLLPHPDFQLVEADTSQLTSADFLEICKGERVNQIIHLAAKAGVRPSILNPAAYYQTNVDGTLNLLEFAKEAEVPHFLFASSSSVYGNHPATPWKETLQDLCPISPYASSKIAGEQLTRVYAQLYDIRFTLLRLFTVFGPRQRPDLAIHKFYNLMKAGKEITLYGDGSTSRDYTFVGDIVNGMLAALNFRNKEKLTIFNLGNGRPSTLLQMVHALEEMMQIKAKIRYAGEQPGDVKQTWADISSAKTQLNYHPETSLKEGIGAFLKWKEKTSKVAY